MVRRRRKSSWPMLVPASSASASSEAVAVGPSVLCCAGSADMRELRLAVRTLLKPNQPSGWALAVVVGGDGTWMSSC